MSEFSVLENNISFPFQEILLKIEAVLEFNIVEFCIAACSGLLFILWEEI